jgi:hypothetical protein
MRKLEAIPKNRQTLRKKIFGDIGVCEDTLKKLFSIARKEHYDDSLESLFETLGSVWVQCSR